MSHLTSSRIPRPSRRPALPTLVDDVLIHIFSYLSFEDRVAVSHANAHLRSVVINVSSFWTSVDIRSGSAASLHRLSTLLERSGSQVADVSLEAPCLTKTTFDDLLASVVVDLHRVRSLTLQLSVRHRSTLLSALITPAPVLESVTVSFYDSPSDDPWELIAGELPTTLFALCAPALRHAMFDAVSLPPEGVPALSHVRDLTLEYSTDTVFDMEALPRNCPYVASLGVSIGMHYADLSSVVPGTGFPNLQKLTLYMTIKRSLSSARLDTLLAQLRFHDVPDVTIHFRGAVSRNDLVAYSDPATFHSNGPVKVAIRFLYERAPPPLSRRAQHSLLDVAFSVTMTSPKTGRSRTLTSWFDLSPHSIAHPQELPRRMLNAVLTPQVVALEVVGSMAWDALAEACRAKAVNLGGIADVTFTPQPFVHSYPGPPPPMLPSALVFFPSLKTVQLSGSRDILRQTAMDWPAFLRECVGADLRPPSYDQIYPPKGSFSSLLP
ncbi:hypothetical protein AURDEDRAFT_124575 [Auricularia subglabra TFB-10046 SS5]|nr:hypothetical protein AURDEDRAFT_124575 [Auricularia subglabra TFB-10046 SS5]